jgi:hypothetical protein
LLALGSAAVVNLSAAEAAKLALINGSGQTLQVALTGPGNGTVEIRPLAGTDVFALPNATAPSVTLAKGKNYEVRCTKERGSAKAFRRMLVIQEAATGGGWARLELKMDSKGTALDVQGAGSQPILASYALDRNSAAPQFTIRPAAGKGATDGQGYLQILDLCNTSDTRIHVAVLTTGTPNALTLPITTYKGGSKVELKDLILDRGETAYLAVEQQLPAGARASKYTYRVVVSDDDLVKNLDGVKYINIFNIDSAEDKRFALTPAPLKADAKRPPFDKLAFTVGAAEPQWLSLEVTNKR